MNIHRSPKIRYAVSAALCFVSLAGFSQSGFAAPNKPEPALSAAKKASDAELPALARRGTGVTGALNTKAMNAPEMSFALPDGRVVTAVRQRTAENTARGAKSWIGTFTEEPGSIVTLTTYKGVTAGSISYGDETWELIPAKGGKHVLYRVDVSKLPTAEPEVLQQPTDLELLTADATSTTLGTTAATSGGYVQDLLVVYTPKAAAQHGQATLETMIQNAVAMANQAYQNSNVGITLNLVGLQSIAYTETGAIQTSLNDLRGTTDGKIDSIHKLRDTLGADLVSMISMDSDACGIAGVMTNVSTSSSYMGFSVVKSTCLSQHSLAHELGHNQGNKHDRDNATTTGAYPYSFGFRRCVSDGTGFRTVMAYSCTGAKRVAWFSNPDVTYNGYATGIDYAMNPANSADNARSMNNTAAVVAAFRAGTSSTPVAPTVPTAPSSLAASATAYNSVTVRWTDNSGDETGFRLERSGNGVDFSEIASLGAAATSFVDNGVVASSNYYYRVRAFNSVGNSVYSNTGSVTTPAVPAPAPEPTPAPAQPSSVAAKNGADGSATVTWVDASTNETGFEVRRETWDAKRKVWKSLITVGTVPSGFTSLGDMSGNGTFRYTVRAVNSGGASGLAGPASVTVTGAPTKGPTKGRASK
jgi:peptidyl-Asp metalloendopeptidase